MITKYFLGIFKLHLLIAGFVLLIILNQSCGDNPANAPGDYIAGTITFANTNFVDTNIGHYSVSLFAYQSNPYCQQPVRSDKIQVINSTQSYYYKLTNVESNTYYIGVTWIPNSNPPSTPWVLGTYGCDTANASSCTSYQAIEFPNYSGTASINFSSQTHYYNRINTNCP